jgi:hypothetical protein
MQKQEKAFTSWINTLLLPYTPDFLRSRMEDEQAEALTSRRLTAQVRAGCCRGGCRPPACVQLPQCGWHG